MPSAVHTLNTEVVVLRHSNWGEADRLLVIFSREAGKLRSVAKGARKIRSRKAGHLEPFTRVKVLLAHGRDFWIVTQAETVDAYLPIREDLLRTAYASRVIELLDRFSYEEGANKTLYQLLIDTLERVSTLPDPFPGVFYYEIRLLDIMGFRPELNNCVRCDAEIKAEDQFFDANLGGALCPRCGHAVPSARPISLPSLKILRHYQRSTFREASRVEMSEAAQRDVESHMNYYFSYLLERRLNTTSFLHEIRRDLPE